MCTHLLTGSPLAGLGLVLVSFHVTETKYLAPKAKGGKIYLDHSLKRFQSLVGWLKARGHDRGTPEERELMVGRRQQKEVTRMVVTIAASFCPFYILSRAAQMRVSAKQISGLV